MDEPIYPYQPVPPTPGPPAPVPLDVPFGPTQWNEWARASLFERRAVLLDGLLDDALAMRVASELMLLESDGDDPIELRIDSAGGALGAALTLVDVVDLLAPAVHAVVVGRAEGPALAVLAVSARRVAAPHARLRFGVDQSQADGRAADVLAFAARQRDQVRELAGRLATVGSLDLDTIEDKIMRRAPLSLDEAVRWGFLDAVAEPEARVLRLPRKVGFRR